MASNHYEVEVPRRTQKQVARLPEDVRNRVDNAVRGLARDPRPPGSRKLSGRGDEWRIRVGNYRVVYEVADERRTVLILEVWHRQRNYR